MKILRVHYRCNSLQDYARDHLGDVGRASIFVRSRQLLPSGTRLGLDLRLADGSAVFAGSGTVLYATEELPDLELPSGMEIRLDELTPESARVHRWLLARRARQRSLASGTRRFRDTIPGLGDRPARASSPPAMPEPVHALDARGANFCTRGTDPDLEAEGSGSNPLPVYLLPSSAIEERVELVGPLLRH